MRHLLRRAAPVLLAAIAAASTVEARTQPVRARTGMVASQNASSAREACSSRMSRSSPLRCWSARP